MSVQTQPAKKGNGNTPQPKAPKVTPLVIGTNKPADEAWEAAKRAAEKYAATEVAGRNSQFDFALNEVGMHGGHDKAWPIERLNDLLDHYLRAVAKAKNKTFAPPAAKSLAKLRSNMKAFYLLGAAPYGPTALQRIEPIAKAGGVALNRGYTMAVACRRAKKALEHDDLKASLKTASKTLAETMRAYAESTANRAKSQREIKEVEDRFPDDVLTAMDALVKALTKAAGKTEK